jgi:hypothetical protein
MSVKAVMSTTMAVLLVLVVSGTSADAGGGVRFTKIQYDSPGADSGSNLSLDAEWFKLTNHGSQSKSLSGWTVRDPQSHVYKFPQGYKLGAGKTVTVHTGSGTTTKLNRFWGQDNYVWNNSADKATLKKGNGTKIDVCKWSSVGSGSTNC